MQSQDEINGRLDAISEKLMKTLLKGRTPAEVQRNALSKLSAEEVAALKRDARSRRRRWWQFWKWGAVGSA